MQLYIIIIYNIIGGIIMQYLDYFFSPVKHQDFIWYIKYKDGTMSSEFDNNGIHKEWSETSKEDMEEYGLIGRGLKFFFNTNDGIIKCEQNSNISSMTKNDDPSKIFTTKEDKDDIAICDTYRLYCKDNENNIYNISELDHGYDKLIDPLKKVMVDMEPNSDEEYHPTIKSYMFGYEKEVPLNLTTLKVSVIYKIEMDKGFSLEVSITPKSQIGDIDLYLNVNGNEISAGKLEKNKLSEFAFVIK
jgi:hypothetical protein